MMANKTIYVSLTFATVMLFVSDKDIIKGAPPVFKSWIGKHYSTFYSYYSKRGMIVKTEIMKNGRLVRV